MTAEQPVLHHVTHERFVADVQAIAAQLDEGEWRPDHIVGIGRGGLVPAAYLSHRTGIAMLSVDYSAGVAGFSADRLVALGAMSAAGTRLLLVDDINDSGATLARLHAAIVGHGGVAENQRVAVLITNRRSQAPVDYAARTIDRVVDKDWFVFPWESLAPEQALIAEAREVPDRLA